MIEWRILKRSIAIAAVFLLLVLLIADKTTVGTTLLLMIVMSPVFLFSEFLGDCTGLIGHWSVDTSSPAWLIRGVLWIIVALPLIGFLMVKIGWLPG